MLRPVGLWPAPQGDGQGRSFLSAWRAAFLLAVAATILAGLVDGAFAQAGPFGVPRGQAPPPPPAPTGLSGWLLAKQGEFYRALSGAVRAAKADGTAAFALLGLSFAYGVFHAAGPGHGKAVISSYLFANNETWRRGLVLSFASALLQALVAIALVGIGAVVLGATAKSMGGAVRVIEIVSYGLIALIGAWLLWKKGGAFIAALRMRLAPRPATVGAAAHDHHRHHHAAHEGHVHDETCGHLHGPTPQQLEGPGGWRRGLSAIVAVGLRPCSGAILVLVFALAQGLFWVGVASTFAMGVGTAITVAVIATVAVVARDLAGRVARSPSGTGTLVLRGAETVAAGLVLAFGLLLLTGYLASERLMGL
jgi:ABC-type nickel/cobalt efflux system permease component RcnA